MPADATRTPPRLDSKENAVVVPSGRGDEASEDSKSEDEVEVIVLDSDDDDEVPASTPVSPFEQVPPPASAAVSRHCLSSSSDDEVAVVTPKKRPFAYKKAAPSSRPSLKRLESHRAGQRCQSTRCVQMKRPRQISPSEHEEEEDPRPKKTTGSRKRKSAPLKKKKIGDDASPLREIRGLETSTNFAIPRLSFARLVKEISKRISREMLGLTAPPKWQSLGLIALQEAAENYLIGLFEDANMAVVHAGRVTIFPRDLQLIGRLRRSG